jgi:predicted dehydrogenase
VSAIADPLRLGFVGAGSFATWTLYPALHLAPIRLVAVCDLDEARARSTAETFGAARWYTDYRELWANEELEALIICMRPRERQALVREALESGYDVLVPKPPAASLATTVELADHAARCGRILMVDFQRRFSFGVRRAKELMAGAGFGRLTQLHCTFCSGRYDARGEGYENEVEAFLLDFAVHHLDLARYLGGEVRRLALFSNAAAGGGSYAVALEFESSAVGTLQLSSQRIWHRNYDRIELTGQGAYVVLDDLWRVRHYEESQSTFTENYCDERVGELTGDGPALAEFVAAIREGREPVAGIRDCVETMRLYQAVHDAVAAGRSGAVDLPR